MSFDDYDAYDAADEDLEEDFCDMDYWAEDDMDSTDENLTISAPSYSYQPIIPACFELPQLFMVELKSLPFSHLDPFIRQEEFERPTSYASFMSRATRNGEFAFNLLKFKAVMPNRRHSFGTLIDVKRLMSRYSVSNDIDIDYFVLEDYTPDGDWIQLHSVIRKHFLLHEAEFQVYLELPHIPEWKDVVRQKRHKEQLRRVTHRGKKKQRKTKIISSFEDPVATATSPVNGLYPVAVAEAPAKTSSTNKFSILSDLLVDLTV